MSNTEAMKKAREKYKDNKNRINTDIDKQIYDIMLQYCTNYMLYIMCKCYKDINIC